MPQFYKTKKCPWFAVGRCRMDKDCNWAHSIDELRPSVDLTRTKLCDTQLREGICRNPQCRYAHSRKELRATSDLFKTSLCVYWIKGSCVVGDSCRYAHGIEELRSKPQKGEFVPLDVETLPVPIQKITGQKHDLPINFDGRNNFSDNKLYHPYSAISTTSSLGSINKFGSENIDKSLEPMPSFVTSLFNVDNNRIGQPLSERNTWQAETIHLSNQFTPLNLLDIPLAWREKSSGHQNNNLSNLHEPLCSIGSNNQHFEQFINQSHMNDMIFNRNQMSNKRQHNNEFDGKLDSVQTTKRSYPGSIEEMYSYTPSTASSIRDKISLHNLEV
ncbi:zinc-finger domain-containing protein [Cryptosporidium ubiquitum]|uniref:Zinc-finger domain-containing protein n=1 Tax=Cryptosporidium ubiquitum TaxID=857276 RepID=A0A1J4MHU1_9CRYT|nr:zinc-finger domain-containing protein [Cryptosporidium ubiquitum]OII73027.1 zinc-finger domain-containing protein [Cryptosporidium ubiquitum]